MHAYLALTDELRNLLDRASSVVAGNKEDKSRNVAYRMLQSAKAKGKARKTIISIAAASPLQQQAEGGAEGGAQAGLATVETVRF